MAGTALTNKAVVRAIVPAVLLALLALAVVAHAQSTILFSLASGISGEASGANYTFTKSGYVAIVNGSYTLAYPPGVATAGANGGNTTQIGEGTSNAATWYYATSTVYYDSADYPYGLVVSGSATISPGGWATPPASYAAMAVSIHVLSTPYSGTLYFKCDAQNDASTAQTFYYVFILTNGTWTYVEFISTVQGAGAYPSFNFATGPSGYFTPGTYLYECISADPTTPAIENIGTAGVFTSQSLSSPFGTMYAASISSITSGSTVYLTWSASSPQLVFVSASSVSNILYSLARGISGETNGSSYTFTLPNNPTTAVVSGSYNILAYPPGTYASGTSGGAVTQVGEGTSGDATWYYTTSTSVYVDSNKYPYGLPSVSGPATVAIGSTASIPASFAAMAVTVNVLSSPYDGTIYFHCDVYNGASSSLTYNGVYILTNGTWTFVTFYSASVASSSWFNPSVTGPTGYFDAGTYLYECAVYTGSTAGITTVGTAGVFTSTTESTSTTFGTQYSVSISSIISGSTVYLTWSSSSPVQFTYSGVLTPYVIGSTTPSTWPTVSVAGALVTLSQATNVVSNTNSFTISTSSSFSPVSGATDAYLSTSVSSLGNYYVPIGTYSGVNVFATAFYTTTPPTSYAELAVSFYGGGSTYTASASVSVNGTSLGTVTISPGILVFGNTGDSESISVSSSSSISMSGGYVYLLNGTSDSVTVTVPNTATLYLPTFTQVNGLTTYEFGYVYLGVTPTVQNYLYYMNVITCTSTSPSSSTATYGSNTYTMSQPSTSSGAVLVPSGATISVTVPNTAFLDTGSSTYTLNGPNGTTYVGWLSGNTLYLGPSVYTPYKCLTTVTPSGSATTVASFSVTAYSPSGQKVLSQTYSNINSVAVTQSTYLVYLNATLLIPIVAYNLGVGGLVVEDSPTTPVDLFTTIQQSQTGTWGNGTTYVGIAWYAGNYLAWVNGSEYASLTPGTYSMAVINLPQTAMQSPITLGYFNPSGGGQWWSTSVLAQTSIYVTIGVTAQEVIIVPGVQPVNQTTPNNKTVISIGTVVTGQPIVNPIINVNMPTAFMPSLATPQGFLLLALVAAGLAYYVRESRNIAGIAGFGVLMALIGFALGNYALVVAGASVAVIAVAVYYVKSSTAQS